MPVCPECLSREMIRFGTYGNQQRWRCKPCKKTTISPRQRIPSDYRQKQSNAISNPVSGKMPTQQGERNKKMLSQQKTKRTTSLSQFLPLVLKDKVIYDAEGKMLIVWVGAKRKDIEKAKFMVKACNIHKELLQGCKDATYWLDFYDADLPHNKSLAVLKNILTIAISKVGKGE